MRMILTITNLKMKLILISFLGSRRKPVWQWQSLHHNSRIAVPFDEAGKVRDIKVRLQLAEFVYELDKNHLTFHDECFRIIDLRFHDVRENKNRRPSLSDEIHNNELRDSLSILARTTSRRVETNQRILDVFLSSTLIIRNLSPYPMTIYPGYLDQPPTFITPNCRIKDPPNSTFVPHNPTASAGSDRSSLNYPDRHKTTGAINSPITHSALLLPPPDVTGVSLIDDPYDRVRDEFHDSLRSSNTLDRRSLRRKAHHNKRHLNHLDILSITVDSKRTWGNSRRSSNASIYLSQNNDSHNFHNHNNNNSEFHGHSGDDTSRPLDGVHLLRIREGSRDVYPIPLYWTLTKSRLLFTEFGYVDM